jgi:hypothetical protein
MSLKNWWYTLIKEEWELKFSVPASEAEILPDGTRIEHTVEKVFRLKKMIKIKPDHFIFIDIEDHRQEINLTAPVSYSIKKIY